MNFVQVHHCSLSSQTNVYGCTTFALADKKHRILTASVQGKVTSLEFEATPHLRATKIDVPFTYIPEDAEIVAIDAFVRPPNGLVDVGIAIIKQEESRKRFFLNVYGSHNSQNDPRASFSWNDVVDDFQPCELDFLPYHLIHSRRIHGDDGSSGDGPFFLLSGGDGRVHHFQICKLHGVHEKSKKSIDFPQSIGNVTRIEIFNDNCTALGSQNGVLTLILNEKTSSLKICDGPITALKLFRFRDNDKRLNLLVGCAMELAIVYEDVDHVGLTKPVPLPSSDRYDSVLCVAACDVTWDGQKELLIGTYGQKLLIYKKTTSGYGLVSDLTFAQPLYFVDYVDVFGDGVRELVVTSLSGLHVFQHNIDQVKSFCEKRLASLCSKVV